MLDQSYPTASFTDSSPLLFLLGCWGVVTAFRPREIGQVRLTRIILLGAAAGAGGVLLWGYISQRYLGDLMPFFIIASGIALIDVWRRLEARPQRVKGLALGAVVTIGAYCVAANSAIAAFPVAQFTMAQSARFLSVEKSLSIDSLASSVWRGSTLPYWGPAGQLFATDNCSGLYLSTGSDMKNVPGQQIEHYTWMPVEQSPAFTHIIGFTFNRPLSDFTHAVTLMTYGKSRLVMERSSVPGLLQLHLYNAGTSISWPSPIGWKFPITASDLHQQLEVVVTIDPNLHSFSVTWYDDEVMINHYVAGDGPAVVKSTEVSLGSALPVVTVSNVPLRSSEDQYLAQLSAKSPMSLCRSLTQSS